MTTTYTLFRDDDSSQVYGRGYTLAEAAQARLTQDGDEYRVWMGQTTILGRPTATYELQVRAPGRKWTTCWDGPSSHGTTIYIVGGSRAEAEAQIWERVRLAEWRDHLEIMTDAEYDAMMAEIAAEAEG